MSQNNRKNDKKVVVGMSGGVDSSISLLLLKKQGWDPVGVSLKYAVWQNEANLLRQNVCCSQESFTIAKQVCKKLNVPHHIVDVSAKFKKKVIDYFVDELKNNQTPNPCIICNRQLKFKELFAWAKEHKINHVASGHYARIKQDPKSGQFKLLTAKDKHKDQTYSLSFLSQNWLKNIVFPLGELTKKKVFQIAKKEGFEFYLKRKESQNFCFVANNCLDCFLEEEISQQKGLIKNPAGQILGKHQGLHFFTIGQRRGIGLNDGPYYVTKKLAQENVLVVSKDRVDLLFKKAILSPVNFISGQNLSQKKKVKVKIRSQQTPAKATLIPAKINNKKINSRKIELVFTKPQRAVTPGQFAVFYDGEICLGGGKILSAEKATK